MHDRLFPEGLPHREWVDFASSGFDRPVTGIIYGPEAPPTNGVPLGGIDTGCLDLEATGMLGFLTIFNSLAPRRGPLNRPFLGLRINDEVHVLASHGMPGVRAPKRIDYWGHYPVADMEFELDAPLSVGVRAWSPFIPGDVDSSMIPAAVFEVHLRNESDQPVQGTLAMSFPGMDSYEIPFQPNHRHSVTGAFTGELMEAGGHYEPFTDERAIGYALGVIGGDQLQVGPDFGSDPVRWAMLGTEQVIPPRTPGYDNSGMSVSVAYSLEGGDTTVVRFLLAWYAPRWCADGQSLAGGNKFLHMYASRFENLYAVAKRLAGEHEVLLARVLRWQESVYEDEQLPSWLRDSLVNILHLITETGVWAQAAEPIGDWCRPEDGLFGLNEDPRSCPQIECLPCSVYGNLPLVYFFPHLVASTLRGEKAYQYEDGRPAWIFGGVTSGATGVAAPYDMAAPDRGYQEALNGYCIVEMVHKLWRCSGDDQIVNEFYDMCKRATMWTMTLRPEYGDKQVVAMPSGDTAKEWFEAPEPGWRGYANHVGGLRLSQMLMMKRMADAVGDREFADQTRRWFDAGAEAMEEYLWNGSHYLNYSKPETNETSDLVFGYQLDGQWFADFHGTERVFPPERVRTALETINRCNVSLSRTGVVNYANPDGSPAQVGGYGTYSYFPPQVLMLAMTYMYAGEKEFGLDLSRRCWRNIVCDQRRTWNQPNLARGDVDTGEYMYGQDYYQNMMLWSLPAAIAGEDLSGPCKPGGLVDRVIEAGRASS